jgi:hypothetical protein
MVVGYPLCVWVGFLFTLFGGLGLAGTPHDDAATTGFAVGVFVGFCALVAIPTLWIYGIVNAYRAAERRNRQVARGF